MLGLTKIIKEDEMRKTLSVAVICLAASVVFAATGKIQPLNVMTGLWQMTETVTWTGLPPQFAAMMKNAQPISYKSCVKPKDLSTNPWGNGSSEKCTWTAVNSTGTDMDVRATGCDLGKDYGMTAEVHGKIHVLDSEHGTGSMEVILTGNGQTMNGHASYTGKWIAPTCPAGMN
jgi:uncharacterized protein DUF3617